MATSLKAYIDEASPRKLLATVALDSKQKAPDGPPIVRMVSASHPRGSVAAWATRAFDEKPRDGTKSVAHTGAWWLREVTANLPDRCRPARGKLSGSREHCRERRN
jgi:hypothetical protein